MYSQRFRATLHDPRIARLVAAAPYLFPACLVVAVSSLIWSRLTGVEAATFLATSALFIAWGVGWFVWVRAWWWWFPVVVFGPWLILEPLLEPTRVGLLSIPHLFLLVLSVPTALLSGVVLFFRQYRDNSSP